MALIKNGALIDDPWITVDDEGDLREATHPIVSLERWRAEADELRRRQGPLGIRLKSDQSPELIASDLDRFEVVALEFPRFTDGRAYSHARLLRERYGYERELRAVGNVLRDQFLFMLRCGFDAFEVAGESPLENWREATSEFSVWYQPTADGRVPVMARRHHRP